MSTEYVISDTTRRLIEAAEAFVREHYNLKGNNLPSELVYKVAQLEATVRHQFKD